MAVDATDHGDEGSLPHGRDQVSMPTQGPEVTGTNEVIAPVAFCWLFHAATMPGSRGIRRLIEPCREARLDRGSC